MDDNVSANGTQREYEGKNAALVFSRDLSNKLSLLPNIGHRQHLVHSLIQSYGLMKKLRVVAVQKATPEDLLMFHSQDYVKMLKNPCSDDQELDENGLGYDCPIFDNMLDFCLTVAGSSITAAHLLLSGMSTVLNWSGGWHHSHRTHAAGFCYVNDIVLAIHKLQAKFKKILYIDLDVHHGDGVEEAFSFTNRVATFSVHKYEAGYFPGTGDVSDVGCGRGKYYSFNVPLQEGVNNTMYRHIFTSIFPVLMNTFGPDCVVLQCGADCLVGDKLGGFNLTPKAICECVQDVLSYNLPTLVLGGGGYNIQNTARLWVAVTAKVLGLTLDEDIPDEDHFFTQYGPDFQLDISPGCVRNKNKPEDIDVIINTLKHNISLMDSTKM